MKDAVFSFLSIDGWTEFWWVTLGLVAQLSFSARFIIQWIASERAGQSYIPIAFWWLSIVGGLFLLSYAIYRQDVVFILGQSMGVLVYSRNLMLIYRKPPPPALEPAPGQPQ